MKKICTMIIAALCAVSMSAQMRIWYNGQKLSEINLSMIDSITFVKSGEPVNPDTGSVTPPQTDTTAFDYDHWREVTKVNMFISQNGGYWDSISLPWAGVSSTTIPKRYRKPNEEDKWELAFNLLSGFNLPGTHMFGLWDRKASRMRIYVYLEEMGNSQANYCYFVVRAEDGTAFIERDAMGWMPSDSIIKKGNWNPQALSNAALVPSDQWCQVMPITGTLDGEVNPGWLCFELNFSAGNFTLPLNSSISFALYGQEEIDFSGAITIDEYMKTESGSITIPGNKTRMWAGYAQAAGSLISGVGTGIATGFGSGHTGDADVTGGILQIVGSAFSFVGDMMNASEEGKDKKYSIDLAFHTTGTDQIQATLTSTLPTSFSGVSMDYQVFFGEILKHQSEVAGAPVKDSASNFSIGAWNLKYQPVLYVCRDASYQVPSDEQYQGYHPTALASFLDPTSIEVQLNKDSFLFDGGDLDTITIVACDFVFANDKYTIDAKPYYTFYDISQDSIDDVLHWAIPLGEEWYKKFLLDTTVTDYTTYRKAYDTYKYTGVATQLSSDYGMDAYNLIYSPAILPFHNNTDYTLSEISVAVTVEMTFKDGQKRIFAERFLPQIKTFNIADAQALKDSFQTISAPTMIGDVNVQMPLFDMQKARALRMLEPMIEPFADSYPLVFIDYPQFGSLYTANGYWRCGYGLRIREYQDEETPGIVIRTYRYMYCGDCYASAEKMYEVRSAIVHDGGNWDAVNSKLEKYGMCPLNNSYHYADGGNMNIQTGGQVGDGDWTYHIQIYYEDADGNLTLVQQ